MQFPGGEARLEDAVATMFPRVFRQVLTSIRRPATSATRRS